MKKQPKSIPVRIVNGKFQVNKISGVAFTAKHEGDWCDIVPRNKKRTLTQNNALHLFYQQLADELNSAGLDMKTILKPTYNIPWTVENVKENLWRPLQKHLFKKESTTDLNKLEEIEKIHEVLMRELGERRGVEYIQFPHKCPNCHSIDCVCG